MLIILLIRMSVTKENGGNGIGMEGEGYAWPVSKGDGGRN